MASSKKLPKNKNTANAHDFLFDAVKQQLITLFKQQHLARPNLLVAYSGGLDSSVLLHLLAKLAETIPFHLSAMHVHHGLSPHADQWAASCEAFCKLLTIPFSLFCVNLNKQNGLGIEAEARQARYNALATAGADIVCLGHHQDDQAETLLLQLARGAGVKGLASMAITDNPRQLFRPFLNVARSQLLAYAEHHHLNWIDDESNEDTRFDRNFMRHQVMPLLDQQYPNIQQRLARTASHMAEASQLLDALAEVDAKAIIDHTAHNGALRLSLLIQLSQARQKNLVRWWLRQNHLAMPSTAVLDQIIQQLASPRVDTEVKVKVSDERFIMRYQGLAYLVVEPEITSDYDLTWQGEEMMVLPDLSRLFFTRKKGEGIDLVKISDTAQINIRKRQGGETIKPVSNRPARSLKQLFQECQLPPWQRQHLPLIYLADQLVVIPNIAIDVSVKAAKNQPSLSISWRQF